MSAAGVLFRDGNWVDIDDYNYIIKMFNSMGYKSLTLRYMSDCWKIIISNDDILDKIEKENDWDNGTGTMILYFYWIETSPERRMKVYGIKEPVFWFFYIEGLASRSLVILEFLHRYFERFPTDVFWEGGEYYYTKKDIDKMHAREEPDKNWPFIDPATF